MFTSQRGARAKVSRRTPPAPLRGHCAQGEEEEETCRKALAGQEFTKPAAERLGGVQGERVCKWCKVTASEEAKSSFQRQDEATRTNSVCITYHISFEVHRAPSFSLATFFSLSLSVSLSLSFPLSLSPLSLTPSLPSLLQLLQSIDCTSLNS